MVFEETANILFFIVFFATLVSLASRKSKARKALDEVKQSNDPTIKAIAPLLEILVDASESRCCQSYQLETRIQELEDKLNRLMEAQKRKNFEASGGRNRRNDTKWL